jgi:succinylarginine dihydrolase
MAKKATKKTTKKKKATTKKSTTKKKAAKRKSRSKKATAEARKRMVWGVFSSSMKEEARFPYDQRKEAEKKLDQLSSKSKKPFFIQPMKEVIDAPVVKKKTTKKKKSADEEE